MLTNTTELLAIFRKVNLEMDDNIANVYCTYKSNIDCQRTYDTRTYNVRFRQRTTYNVRYRQRIMYDIDNVQRTMYDIDNVQRRMYGIDNVQCTI